MKTEMTKDQILTRIEKLQITRQYSDEIESVRITQEIERLFDLLEEANE